MHGRHLHSDGMIPWFLDDAQGFYFRLGWTTQWRDHVDLFISLFFIFFWQNSGTFYLKLECLYKNDTRSFDFFDMKSLLFSFQIQYWLYKMAENGTSKLWAFAILKIVSDWIFTKFEWKALHVKRIKRLKVERLLTFFRRKIFLTHCTV